MQRLLLSIVPGAQQTFINTRGMRWPSPNSDSLQGLSQVLFYLRVPVSRRELTSFPGPTRVPGFANLGWGLRMCVCNKVPGDPEGDGSQHR